MLKLNLSFSVIGENSGDPRAGGWRSSKRISIFRKNIEKSRFMNRNKISATEKQIKHKK
jgi:hypothetical protein